MKPSRLHRAEPLEHRLALTGLFTFTDVDGDVVAVRTSRGTDAALAASLVLVPSGAGQQLRQITLVDPAFAATDLSVAVRTRAAGGDGRVNVGAFRAGMSLGAVTIRGDLGKFSLNEPAVNSIAKLTVGSIGVLGTTTGATDTNSVVNGSIGSLGIEGSLDRASLMVSQRLEKAVIGGSIIGTSTSDGITAGSLGSISVAGSLFGGASPFSGIIASQTGAIGRVRIGGDVVGGTGDQSGWIVSAPSSGITECRIAGGVLGGGGLSSGRVYGGDGGIGTIVVGSSVVGGAGGASGVVSTAGGIGTARVGGSVFGGTGSSSGAVFADYGIRSMRIGGDLRGGVGQSSGVVWANAGLISQFDVRSIVSGDGLDGASVYAALLGRVTVRGDVIGSATRAVSITAKGSPWSSAPMIGSVRVRGSAIQARVLAGYERSSPVNGAVRIGTVTVGGTLSQSTIAAGVMNAGGLLALGNAGDTGIDAGDSRIDVVAVGGRSMGSGIPGESFGIVARSIGRVRIAGALSTPAAGSLSYPNGDNFAIHVL